MRALGGMTSAARRRDGRRASGPCACTRALGGRLKDIHAEGESCIKLRDQAPQRLVVLVRERYKDMFVHGPALCRPHDCVGQVILHPRVGCQHRLSSVDSPGGNGYDGVKLLLIRFR